MRRRDLHAPMTLRAAALPIDRLGDTADRLALPAELCCEECGDRFLRRTSPPGLPTFCTQVCADRYRRANGAESLA